MLSNGYAYIPLHKASMAFFFIVALCMLLRLFLLFQLMYTFIHFKDTSSH
jgi:hypothetical protein